MYIFHYSVCPHKRKVDTKLSSLSTSFGKYINLSGTQRHNVHSWFHYRGWTLEVGNVLL